jgi:hypothetical protein
MRLESAKASGARFGQQEDPDAFGDVSQGSHDPLGADVVVDGVRETRASNASRPFRRGTL